MRTLLLLLFFSFTATGYSQAGAPPDGRLGLKATNGLFYSVGGTPMLSAKYPKVVSGSPYFNESYMRGKVILSGGRIYDSVYLRLDLVDNSLQFLDADGKEMIATLTPVKSIILYDSVTGKQHEFDRSIFLPATNSIVPGWYQVIADGMAALYKRAVKTVKEDQHYGSATVEQTIFDDAEYYIFYNAVFTRIKKVKEIPELLVNKRDELNKYISDKKVSVKSETDLAGLIEYYNGLPH